MPHIEIYWTGDEGKIRVNDSFKELYDMAKLDCLQDVIADLQKLYNRELKDLWKPKKPD